MAQTDLLKRYLDAGMALTAMTQARAEAIVKELVTAGEVQAEQARETVSELLERSRLSSERMAETVRSELREQISSLGLATKDDIARLERTIREAGAAAASRESTRPSTRSTAKKATAKKATAKKAAAKKAAGRKAGGRSSSGSGGSRT